MNDAVLIWSKFPKDTDKSNYASFDVVGYKNELFAGFDLYKNFNNYLDKTFHRSVMKFDNMFDAEEYFKLKCFLLVDLKLDETIIHYY